MKHLLIHAHGNTAELLAAALRSARNTSAALGPDAEIHVVAQGPLVRLLIGGSPLSADVAETLENANIHVHACENSMNGAGVTTTELLQKVRTVPSAVAYLAERQWDGWAYVTI